MSNPKYKSVGAELFSKNKAETSIINLVLLSYGKKKKGKFRFYIKAYVRNSFQKVKFHDIFIHLRDAVLQYIQGRFLGGHL